MPDGPPPPVPETAKAEVVYVLHGQIIENNLYFRKPQGYSVADITLLADTVHAQWASKVMPTLSADASMTLVKTTDLSSPTGPTHTKAGLVGGSLQVVALPGNCCMVVSFKTAGRGRSSQGRIYIPALTEDMVIGNAIVGTAAALITQRVDEAITAVEAAVGVEQVVVSLIENGLWRPEGLTQEVTSVVRVDNLVDSQRRRLTGRGR